MSNVADKIAHLLRRARDQEGTPEGDTCLRLARELMAKHSVVVVLDGEEASYSTRTLEVLPRFEPWRDTLVAGVCMLFDGVAYRWAEVPQGPVTLFLAGFDPGFPEAVRLYEDIRAVVLLRVSEQTVSSYSIESFRLGYVYELLRVLIERKQKAEDQAAPPPPTDATIDVVDKFPSKAMVLVRGLVRRPRMARQMTGTPGSTLPASARETYVDEHARQAGIRQAIKDIRESDIDLGGLQRWAR